MRVDNKINAKVNIGLFIFLLAVIFHNAFSEILFEREEALHETMVIDNVFKHSTILGVVTITGMTITWVILLLIGAFFIRTIWNRLFVGILSNIKPVNFQEALTISLLLGSLIELITLL